jgi:site-specific recombinase XerD
MLEQYFCPRSVDRILTSWIGPEIEAYVRWATQEGFAPSVVRRRVPLIMQFGEFARARGARTVEDLPGLEDAFVTSWVRRHARRCRSPRALQIVRAEAHAPVHQLLRLVLPHVSERDALGESWPFQDLAPGFRDHLTRERGLSLETISCHGYHLVRFERYLRRRKLASLAELSPALLFGFMMEDAQRLSIGTLHGRCSTLRIFLRYLHRERICPADLSRVVERPRSYRLSGIPRSISSDEVRRVLAAIARGTAAGKRDYAMLLLLVSYGLRAREVAALTFDDLDWKRERFRVSARKAGHSTVFPLSPLVGAALIDYIRDVRPRSRERRVFLRLLPPFRAVQPHVVSGRAAVALRRAGVVVRRGGSHTFRHSCVQRLVDAEFPFKVIGDYVGHRSPSSTLIYAKVAVEALREVAMGDGEEVL